MVNLLIEPHHHYEVLDALLRLLATSQTPTTCITNNFCYQHSDFKSADWVDWKIAKSTETVIKKETTIIKQSKNILCTTIDIFSSLWTMDLRQTRLMAFIHNGHNFFNQHQQLVWNPNAILRSLYYQFRGDFRKQALIADKLDKILVPSESIAEYLKSTASDHLQAKITYLDFAIPQLVANISKDEKITITIPGTLTNKRRDYELTFRVLPELDKMIQQPVELYFLGKKTTDVIITSIAALDLKNIAIHIFDGYIAPEVFHQKLLSTDFLWLPIREKIQYKSFYEIRNKTCVSGNINDMVKYALPVILPEFYQLPSPLEQMAASYQQEEDLVQLLSQWINTKAFNDIKKNSDSILAIHKNQVLQQLSNLDLK